MTRTWTSFMLGIALLASNTWTNAQTAQSMVNDANDRLTRFATDLGAIDYRYDAAGNLRRVVRQAVNLDKFLVGWWSFDACDARDDSGHGHDGLTQGNPECVDSPRGKALRFSGQSYVEIPHHSDFNLAEVTLAAWVRVSGLSSDAQTMILNKEVEYEFGVQGPAVSDQLPQGALAFAFNPNWQWYGSEPAGVDAVHFVVTFNSQFQATAYVNGRAIRTVTYGSAVTPTTNCIRIGARGCPGNAWQHFLGDIEDVRIYSKALSDAEVAALYSRGSVR